MAAANLTAERLRELFYYNPETGLFTRRIDHWSAKAGAIATSRHSAGYIQIGIDGYRYYAHRLAYLYMTYGWPAAEIDHRDGDRINNKWSNLRCATKSQNLQNQRKARSNNQGSGLLGAFQKSNGWMARIVVNKTPIYLGYFSSPEQAHDAYLAAKRLVHEFGTI